MKSFLQSINLLTVAFGDFLVIVVAEVNLFDQVWIIIPRMKNQNLMQKIILKLILFLG